MSDSRTRRSIKNIKVATIFYIVNLILQFFSRKIFLDYLGGEILGLNTTAQNLLGFLNIAELGIGTAVAYNLYKPLYNNNRKSVCEIISIQGWLYKRIAIVVIVGAVIMMAFFPLIFAKADVPLWYAYGTFCVLLLGAMLGYFVNYKLIILSADQKQYKITYIAQSIKIIKIIFQILVVRYFSNGYVWWMVLEAVAALFTAYALSKCVKHEYPWLKTDIASGGQLRKVYPNVIGKTRQVFFHKISGFVLTQTTPLVIYGFASLTMVAIYGNYLIIVTAVIMLMESLLNGIGAGVGNLVAEGNKQQIKKVFWEITSIRIWLALIFCFLFYIMGDSFIALWVGEEYILPKAPFILILFTAFIRMTRTNDIFISAYGLYQDVWAPIAEAVLNIGLSILLGYYYGLTGILSGVLISLLVIVCVWKPYFLYNKGFHESVKEYVVRYGKLILLVLISWFIARFIVNSTINDVNTYWQWIWKGAIVFILISVVSFCLFYLAEKNFRSLIFRVLQYFKSIMRNAIKQTNEI